MTRRWPRRPPAGTERLEQLLRTTSITGWRVEARVDRGQLDRLDGDSLEELAIAATSVDRHPPAAGPEAAVSFTVRCSSARIAERYGRRQLETLGVDVLAIAARPR